MDDELIAHIASHDLRDPLTEARTLIKEILENKTEDAEKLVLIDGLIDEVMKKVSILREYAYISSNREKYQEVDLNIVIHEVIEELSNKIKSADADITISKLPVVSGNKRYLKKLLSCLIDNSIKFRGDNPPKISIEAVEEEKSFHFTITDSGIGVDEVYRELVLLLFQKLNHYIAGYGVGLALAKKIVENHGGEIWYKSDGKSGTVFHFTIRKQAN